MQDKLKDTEFMKNAVEAAIRIGLVALLVYACFDIAKPFLPAIVWGGIIAIASFPLYRGMQNKTGWGNGMTATVFTLIMLAVLITPSIYLTEALLSNAQELSEDLKDGTLDIPEPPENVAGWPLVGKKLDKVWTEAAANPKAAMGKYEDQVKKVANWVIKAAASMGGTLLMFVFSIIIAGIFLARAKGGHAAMTRIMTRLAGERGEALNELSRQTVTSVVNGILGIAILQTLLAGIGFLVMGIPAAGVLALVCLILAVVQIDILIVLIPLSIYAFSFASPFAAVAFLIWNIAVGLMNNVLKPILLARGVEAPMAIIFIGAIGGMLAMGIIGLFVGAVVFVLGYTLFINWLNEGQTAETEAG
ncbi:MAG: AI-2E family transporter [Gammaproteobacteria bacterium]|nr:AI-2E family transporter [Gammaproteobacteria bacterium]